EGADRDLADVVETARGEEPVDDDQTRSRRLLERARRRDPPAVGPLEDVGFELARVAVADHRSLPVLGDDEVGDVGEASARFGQGARLEAALESFEVAPPSVHRALALGGDRRARPRAALEAEKGIANPPSDQLADQPEWKHDQAEEDVRRLRTAVKNA